MFILLLMYQNSQISPVCGIPRGNFFTYKCWICTMNILQFLTCTNSIVFNIDDVLKIQWKKKQMYVTSIYKYLTYNIINNNIVQSIIWLPVILQHHNIQKGILPVFVPAWRWRMMVWIIIFCFLLNQNISHLTSWRHIVSYFNLKFLELPILTTMQLPS